MPKTVHVVDEAGKAYEATYLKRALGLVKKGRARFINDDTICLACPPKTLYENSEEATMEKTMMNTDNTQTTNPITKTAEEATPAFFLPESNDPVQNQKAIEYNVNYCLKKIDEIAKDTAHIHKALEALGSIESYATPNGGSADEQARAALEIVHSREITNQKIVDTYRDMIDRYLPPKKDLGREQERRDQYLKWVKDIIYEGEWELETEDLIKLYNAFQ